MAGADGDVVGEDISEIDTVSKDKNLDLENSNVSQTYRNKPQPQPKHVSKDQGRKNVLNKVKGKIEKGGYSTNTKTVQRRFKENTKNSKAAMSNIQLKAGKQANFCWIMQDNVFNAESKPAAPHAGKTMVYGRGPLYEQFMNEGLKYNTNMFVFANDENMEEQKVFLRPNNLRVPVPEPASEFIDEVTETTSEQAVSVHSEDGEEDLDIYNMKKYAKKVTIGQPFTLHYRQ